MIAHVAVAILQPRLADALRQKPGGLLRDAEFTGHLGGRDAFTGAREHVDGEQPFLQGKAGFRQHCAGTHAEMFPAAPAAVGHENKGNHFSAGSMGNRCETPNVRSIPRILDLS